MDIGRKSRGAYNIQCMMEYFASLLMEDAFLAKLLRHLGMSDALTGIVSSLVTVSFLAELVFLNFGASLQLIFPSPRETCSSCFAGFDISPRTSSQHRDKRGTAPYHL